MAAKELAKQRTTEKLNTNEKALAITAPTRYAEFLQAANAYFKGALRAKYFAFAIQFSTFIKFCVARQVVQVNPHIL